MGLLLPAHVVALTDKVSAGYNAMYGSSASGFGQGDGTFGASLKAADIRGIVEGSTLSIFADADLQSVWVTPALNLKNNASAAIVFANVWTGFVSLMDTVASNARGVDNSITNLDTYMSWYNYGNGATYWQCLAPPDWYYATSAVKNGGVPSPKNLYYEIKQGATYRGITFTNALAKLVVGTGTTLGASVPVTHAGGFAYATWTGLTGSGTLTVVGKDQDGNTETWTGSITGASSTGILLTPQARSYSLITQVTTVSATVVSAGTVLIEARAPSGRTNPPV